MSERRSVIVCGSGLAGFSAALAALDAGARVRLLEKAPHVGGSTALSGGIVWTHVDFADIQRLIPDGNAVLQRVVHGSVTADRDWLTQWGVKFTTPTAVAELGHAGWDHWDEGSDKQGAGGEGRQMEPAQALEALCQSFEELGGELSLETALDGLLSDGRRVTGARAVTSDGRSDSIPADAVVLATGGFQGNAEMIARYLKTSPGGLYLRSNAWSTGDGLAAGMELGAGATPGLDTFYGHALAAPPAQFREMEFSDVTQGYGQAAVAINLHGRRFADESAGTGEEVLNQALARQPAASGYYIVDQQLADRPRSPGKPVTGVILSRASSRGGVVLVANSLEELCIQLENAGVPYVEVSRTLDNYNALCTGRAGARPDGYEPSRARFRFPLLHPPFYAVKVRASITSTFGGLAVDGEMRVLRRSGTSSLIAQSISDMSAYREVPIPGLFAAGNDVGNISHLNYMGGLATALTTGRAAGRAAAAAPWDT